MRLPAAFIIPPLVLAVPVTASRADTLPNTHYHRALPVSSAEAPVPVRKPAPQAVTATPAPVLPAAPVQAATPPPFAPAPAKPPAQTVGVGGVAPAPSQTR